MLTVVLGNERFEVPAGGIAWLPRGVPHTFANLMADPVHVVGKIVPAGLEAMFVEQTAYFHSLKGPPDPDVLLEIGRPYGVSVLGAPIAIPASWRVKTTTGETADQPTASSVVPHVQ